MAVTYGFYDSLNHDRLYNAQQMSAIFDGIINDGVFMSVGNQFHTVAGTGMQVIVKSGRAWFDSTWTLNDAEYPLSIDAADVLLTRIDAIVLEVNSEVATRANTIKVVKGTPASTPAKPTLTNTATIHQHALAYVTIAKNTTAITNSMIEIVVGKTETPYVTAILQTTDITDLYNQWEDYFQTWFDTVRGTLDGDVALNLQNQITSLRRETLKNTTPPIIGLPASATPDDMFRALGNTGELHVWRKTARDASVSAPGYNLGDIKSLTDICQAPSGYQGYFGVKAEYSDEITVNNLGVISLVSPSEIELGFTGKTAVFLPEGADNTLKNKFLKIVSVLAEQPNAEILDSYKDAVIHCESNFHCNGYGSSSPGYNIYFNNFRLVTPYPAGLSTTYPVSTNPNAYQEGDDAKPAGYTLGNVVTGKFGMGMRYASIVFEYSVASEISASDDGTISLKNPTTFTIGSSSGYPGVASNVTAAIAGKYIQLTVMGSATSLMFGPFSSAPSSIVYIPPDTIATREDIEDGNTQTWYFIDRYQPVTGYAAIPAGTTIEYLGKLGDKARVQALSYVGTGTYGEDHPNSLTFDFVPKMLFVVGDYTTDWPGFMFATEKTAYASSGNSSYRLTFTIWNKTVKWYYSDADNQFNTRGKNYDAVAIG